MSQPTQPIFVPVPSTNNGNFDQLDVLGNALIGGNLVVDGTATFEHGSFGPITVTGVTVNGNAVITGNETVAENLTVAGTITTDSPLTINSTVAGTGDVLLGAYYAGAVAPPSTNEFIQVGQSDTAGNAAQLGWYTNNIIGNMGYLSLLGQTMAIGINDSGDLITGPPGNANSTLDDGSGNMTVGGNITGMGDFTLNTGGEIHATTTNVNTIVLNTNTTITGPASSAINVAFPSSSGTLALATSTPSFQNLTLSGGSTEPLISGTTSGPVASGNIMTLLNTGLVAGDSTNIRFGLNTSVNGESANLSYTFGATPATTKISLGFNGIADNVTFSSTGVLSTANVTLDDGSGDITAIGFVQGDALAAVGTTSNATLGIIGSTAGASQISYMYFSGYGGVVAGALNINGLNAGSRLGIQDANFANNLIFQTTTPGSANQTWLTRFEIAGTGAVTTGNNTLDNGSNGAASFANTLRIGGATGSTVTGSGSATNISMPSSSGTLALTSQVPSTAGGIGYYTGTSAAAGTNATLTATGVSTLLNPPSGSGTITLTFGTAGQYLFHWMCNATAVSTPAFTITATSGSVTTQQTAPTTGVLSYFGPFEAYTLATGSFTVTVNCTSSSTLNGLLTVTRVA
jgi:hypothetical protein